MTPYTTPPVWPDVRVGRFASSIIQADPASPDLDVSAFKQGCRVALLGLPDDTGVAMNFGRTGAKAGPAALRSALARYGLASIRVPAPVAGEPLVQTLPRVFDAGDIVPAGSTPEDLAATHERVAAAAEHLVSIGYLPIAIGGGHDLTFPFVQGVVRAHASRRSQFHGRFHGVYLDAHLDVRAEPGSGMPFRRLVESCRVHSLACVGFDRFVNAPEHVEWFEMHGGQIFPPEHALDALDRIQSATSPTFLSIDLDGLDSSFAPGVSAINPCGLAPDLVARFARAAGISPGVRCFDVMELNPSFDLDGRTARLAARLVLEFLSGFVERPAL